ncbi:beta-hydroxyacyl-ACP dehydratase [bacterium]|nr:beta-hydroxyacyl-ACP dehydratase [bacterium]
MIDRITLWEPGVEAHALKNVSLSEDFFDDHFPRRPIMPGVLILEGMAQLGGLLLEVSLKTKYGGNAKALMTVVERVKFRRAVRPGETLNYKVKVLSLNEAGGKISADAFVSDQLTVNTGIVFAFKYVQDKNLDLKRDELMRIWLSPPENCFEN